MALNKRAICKGCGKNYLRIEGLKKHCSAECRLKFPKTRKCKGGCSPVNLFVREVEFANNTFHKQQVCNICRSTTYIGRHAETGPSEQAKIIEALESQSQQRKARYGDSFYSTKEWLQLRYDAFVRYGKICTLCGETKGALHVDHIKPRFKYPALQLVIDNLQILCRDCNLGKGARDDTDWREHPAAALVIVRKK